jgi:hypothetical protein
VRNKSIYSLFYMFVECTLATYHHRKPACHSLQDHGRNPEDGKDFKILAIVQQVLKVALLFPVLERRILLSSRKGAWDRVGKGLVPLSAGGRSR